MDKWYRATNQFTKSGRVFLNAVGAEVEVSACREGDELGERQKNAYEQFVSISSSMKEELLHALALIASKDLYYGHDDPMLGKDREDVWGMIEFGGLHIPSHGKSADRYVILSGRGSWEESEECRDPEAEGVCLLFKNEKLFEFGKFTDLYSGNFWEHHYIDK